MNTDGRVNGSATFRAMPDERYTHGHHPVIVSSHGRRSAANSAAYLLPHLRAGLRLLDVGCGPGSITLDLADRVRPAEVIGIDREPAVLETAREATSRRGLANVRFMTADAYELPFGAAEFDVVHAHQTLQHLADPVAALTEMRRVLRPGGIVAVRDTDYGTMVHSPREPRLERWLELYHHVARANGAECDAGRALRGWVLRAGFDNPIATSSTWTYATDEERSTWAELWAVRITEGSFATQAVDAGLSTHTELADLASAWRDWASRPDGFFAFLHGEVVAFAPSADGTRSPK